MRACYCNIEGAEFIRYPERPRPVTRAGYFGPEAAKLLEVSSILPMARTDLTKTIITEHVLRTEA